MKNIAILGATGSIGGYTLDVIAQHPEQFNVYALTANRDVHKMLQLIAQFSPEVVVMADPKSAAECQKQTDVTVLAGVDGLVAVAQESCVDIVMAAIVGAAGLVPTFAAVQAGKRVCLANKEALVMAGDLFMQAVRDSGAELLPVDSEHNALFQSMPAGFSCGSDVRSHVSKITLTASGGPFRDTPIEQFAHITPAQAVAHPNWSMGQKISVDSATMMNKALEVIEAHWLFAMSPDQIDVVIHPESIIHSMVHYHDRSVLAQMGNPDMCTPIAHTLSYPERINNNVKPLNLAEIGCLNFYPVDCNRFPCLQFAFDVLQEKSSFAIALNAANEVAVDAFLQERIGFTDIPRIIEHTLAQTISQSPTSIEEMLMVDARARLAAQEHLSSSETVILGEN